MLKDKQTIKQRIDRLKENIEKYRYDYHVLDKNTISDEALDSLKRELFLLEQENPQYITSDSPSQRVAGKVLDKFEKNQAPKSSMVSSGYFFYYKRYTKFS